MDGHNWLAERFEESRTHLRTVALRMLGSSSEGVVRSGQNGHSRRLRRDGTWVLSSRSPM
jgi:hypothetical protein